jgi:hypothetical protein
VCDSIWVICDSIGIALEAVDKNSIEIVLAHGLDDQPHPVCAAALLLHRQEDTQTNAHNFQLSNFLPARPSLSWQTIDFTQDNYVETRRYTARTV